MFPRVHTVRTNPSWRVLSSFMSLILFTSLCSIVSAGENEPPVLVPKRVEAVSGVGTDSSAKTTGAFIDYLEINERPLRQVLDYLSTVSGKNIRTKKVKDERLLVTFKLEKVTYRAVLDFIARKYGMLVDDTMEKQNIVFLDTPEKVSMVFNNADIRDVINTIAIQANANIVIGPDINGQVSMRLENVPWKDALNIVVKTLDFVAVDDVNNTIRITTPGKIATQLDIRIFRLAYISPEGSKYTPQMQSDFFTRTGTTTTATSNASTIAGSSLMDVLKSVKTQQGTITFEKRSNTIIVRDTSTALDHMQSIVAKLDIPPKQIHVAVKLVELSDTDMERLGVDWGSGIRFNLTPVGNWSTAFPFDVSNGLSRSLLGDLSVQQGTKRVVDPISGGPATTTDLFSLRRAVNTQGAALPIGGVSPIALGTMGFAGTSAMLEMIRDKTRGRVIQAPQLTTLENEEATIQVGQLVRYAETVVANTEGGGNVGGFREAAGSPLKLGFQLLVIAQVTGPENNVLLTIVPKTENFTGFETFGDLRLPQTTQSIVVTKMMLRNGETGVIGGMKQESESFTDRKVPVFGDIPIIGRLFKHRSKNVSGRNLLVFVTPTIIDFYEAGTFEKDLEKYRNEFSKPFTTVGDEEDASASR
jgi:type IV pilus secretin PilQ/predicted competence protein